VATKSAGTGTGDIDAHSKEEDELIQEYFKNKGQADQVQQALG